MIIFKVEGCLQVSQKQEEEKDSFYWTFCNNVHYSSTHIQQQIQE
jgi:hypothetical protein